MTEPMYMPGYEAWEVFDALPIEVKMAHDIVWTGYPRYTNQFRTNIIITNITMDDAKAIIELDGGRHTLSASDITNDRDAVVYY